MPLDLGITFCSCPSLWFVLNRKAHKKKHIISRPEGIYGQSRKSGRNTVASTSVRNNALSDIFPENNNVASWSIYIVGKNKQILLCQDNTYSGYVARRAICWTKNIAMCSYIFCSPNIIDYIFWYGPSGLLRRLRSWKRISYRTKRKAELCEYIFVSQCRRAAGTGGILFVRLYTSMKMELARRAAGGSREILDDKN
jgi:hypothetical protein